jgi:hypothetical protein
MLTRDLLQKAVEIELHLKLRLRHQGKLINRIAIKLDDQSAFDPTSVDADVLYQETYPNECYLNDTVADFLAGFQCVEITQSRAEHWIQLSEEDVAAIYQQVVDKVGAENLPTPSRIIRIA